MKTSSRTRTMAMRLGWLVLLVLLAAVLIQHSTTRLDREQVVGNYRIILPPMFAVSDAPATVEMHADGRIRTSTSGGVTIQEGTWWWDGSEDWVLSDVPGLDHRIRGYLGWTGPKLFWRDQPGTEDLEEFPLETMEP